MSKKLMILSCDDCGACCLGQATLPIHLVAENGVFRLEGVNPLPGYLRDRLVAIRNAMIKDGFPSDTSPCIWYDRIAKGCRYYNYRPTLCRDRIQPGDKACQRWRIKRGIG